MPRFGAGGFDAQTHLAVCRSGDSTAIEPALTPKPVSSFPDRVSFVPTAEPWAARSGSHVSAAPAGSAGFQIFVANLDSAHRYVAVCGFLDLTSCSPWIVVLLF